jgi:hypothetical protein
MFVTLLMSLISLTYAETTNESEPSYHKASNTQLRVGACFGGSSDCLVYGLEVNIRDYRTHFQSTVVLNHASLSGAVAYRFNSEPKTFEPYRSISAGNVFFDPDIVPGLSLGSSVEFGDSSVFADISLTGWKILRSHFFDERTMPGAKTSVSYGF